MKKTIIIFSFLFFPLITYGATLFTNDTLVTCNSNAGGAECPRTVDSSTATDWVTNNTLPATWTYDFGASTYAITEINIYRANGIIKDFTFEGSDNGSSWTTLLTDTISNATGWATSTVSNTTTYRYYKVNITTNWRGDNYAGVVEITGDDVVVEEEDPPVDIGTTTASTTPYANIEFGLGIIIVLLSFGLIGGVWYSFNTKKKPWQK